ncbi:MAG: copper amine oxidase N-terminal domain-containing protein, partial [Caldisericia bacterium]|nr:copper amine oxidase N-terminal domain-containing protein [Caldisericia bacterium]
FNERDSIGTFSISKKDLVAPKRRFSLNSYVFYLPEEGRYSDAAPDDQSMKLFKTSEKPPETKLMVNQTSLDFGEIRWRDRVTLPLYFENQGEGTIQVAISASSNISVSPSSVRLSEYERSFVNVNVESSDLDAGIYSETVELNSDYGSETVRVYFEILPKPLLEVNLNSINFGDCYRGQVLKEKMHVCNARKGPIRVVLSSDSDWFRADVAEFDEHEKYIEVYLTTKRSIEGPLSGEIKINSDGGEIRIPVEANLKPSILLEPSMIDYGTVDIDDFDNEAIEYVISNNTNKTLDVQVTNNEAWLQCANTNIKIPNGESKTLKIALLLDKMEEMNTDYEGLITISSDYDTLELPVKVHLTQTPPKLEWIHEEKDQECKETLYKGQSFEHCFIIKNTGSGELKADFDIDKSEANFRLFTRPCTLKADECEEVLIKLDARTLGIGTYHSSLTITSNGGDLSIPIVVEIVEIPVVVITLTIGSAIATINKKVTMLEEPPYIKKSTTMVPLRFIGEAFDADIEWQNIGQGRIIVESGENTIQLDIGKTTAFVNGEPQLLPVAPEIKSGRTFVPLRFISEGFGATIDWDGKTQMITITYTMPIPEKKPPKDEE